MTKKEGQNAQESDSWRAEDESVADSNSHNQEAVETNFNIIRDEPKRVNRAVGKGGRPTSSQEVIGGILNRLRVLQSMHLEYVESHEKRLEQRLIENHTHKSKVSEEMRYLETELVHLLKSTEVESRTEHE
ncbi:MAG: hypothetical protein QNJ74_16160 [Trichodesmium sp. MO_231.B1]|nr:hypothetical protein [Trichodesmium sp. MO_231.B1]